MQETFLLMKSFWGVTVRQLKFVGKLVSKANKLTNLLIAQMMEATSTSLKCLSLFKDYMVQYPTRLSSSSQQSSMEI
jgi:hypothetical protein